MFHFIAQPLASLLAFLYGLVPNYGVAIALLTIVVMVVLTPFTVKSTRSMLAMQRLQPEMKRLQQEHKNDRQAYNEAMMAFYKEHNISPVSGCLPMLLQMPIFIGLYEAIRGLTHNPPSDLSHSSKLFEHLCPNFDGQHCMGAKDFAVSMKVLGVDLAKSVGSHHSSVAAAAPFYLLLALTTLTQYYMQRQISNRNPQAAQANPQMQMMTKFMPIIFVLIYIRIPAAVVVYFLVSNMLRIAQQGAMWRWDPKLVAEVAADISEVDSKAKAIDAKARPTGKGRPTPSAKNQNAGTGKAKPQPPRNNRTQSNGKSGSETPGKQAAPPAAQGGNGSQKPPPGKLTGGGRASGTPPRQRGKARRGR